MTETKHDDPLKATMISLFDYADEIITAWYGSPEMILHKSPDPPFFIAEEMKSELDIRARAFEETLKLLIELNKEQLTKDYNRVE